MLAVASSAFAQAPEAFRAESRLVTLDVTVRDKRTGSRVDGLRVQDFQVLDNGKAQRITHFSAPGTAPPLALFLVFDLREDTIKENVAVVRGALMPVLRQLRPEDHVGIIWHWYAGHGVLQPLTADRDRPMDAFFELSKKQEEIRALTGEERHALRKASKGSTWGSGEHLAAAIRLGLDRMIAKRCLEPGALS